MHHYRRRGQLASPRNSKSEQSSRQHASTHDAKTRRNRRLNKQSSGGGEEEQEEPSHPPVTHTVQIGKPKKQPQLPAQQLSQQQSAAKAFHSNGNSHANGVGNVPRTGAQSRFDAFDNDDDDFFDDDGGGDLSDDSLTLGDPGPAHMAAPSAQGASPLCFSPSVFLSIIVIIIIVIIALPFHIRLMSGLCM